MARTIPTEAAAELEKLFQDRERVSLRSLTRDAVIAAPALAYSFWTVYRAGDETIARGFLLLTAGTPVYVWMKWRQARESESPNGRVESEARREIVHV